MQFVSLRQTPPGTMPPWLAWTIMIAFISSTEYILMLVLPLWLPDSASPTLGAILDSVLLTVLLAPVLWWVVVRPLQQAALLRDRFLADLFRAIEEDRRRIAHELHDGVGQSLTLLVSGLKSLPDKSTPEDIERRSSDLKQLAQRALRDIKQLALGLRPSLLDDLGLTAAIERIASEIQEHHPVNVSLELESLEQQRLPGEVETVLFRVFQEAVSNVVKHAQASEVSVKVSRDPQSVTLEIADNGRGMETRTWNDRTRLTGHLGLIGMAERAALFGGKLEIDSGLGRGTRISVRIPLDKAVHE